VKRCSDLLPKRRRAESLLSVQRQRCKTLHRQAIPMIYSRRGVLSASQICCFYLFSILKRRR